MWKNLWPGCGRPHHTSVKRSQGNNRNLLVGVHVHGPGSDGLQEEQRPVRGPLGAPLHRVKHSSHLAQRKTRRENQQGAAKTATAPLHKATGHPVLSVS